MKKLLSVSLAFFLILSFSLNGQAQGVSPENNINRNEISQEVWNKYMQLEEFQRHYKENPKDAKSMIERIIDHNMKILNEEDSIKPMSGNGTIALIYYPEFKQKNSYYCGPASALTAIYGMGKEGQVRGSTYTAKQDTLAANMGTINDGNGTYVYRMRNELNKYSTEVYDYFYEPSKSSMDNIIFGSLLSDNAPILHAQTEKIGYYNGHKTGHYITVVFANAAFGYSEIGGLAVMDNNPDNAYYGSHSISFNEAYNAIRGRYLIGVSL